MDYDKAEMSRALILSKWEPNWCHEDNLESTFNLVMADFSLE